MKTLFLSIIICMFGYTVQSQVTGILFYETLFNLTKKNNNDSVNYYLIKLKVGKSGFIRKAVVLFFKNDSIQSIQLNNNNFHFTIEDILTDTLNNKKYFNNNKWYLYLYITKRVKFITNPKTEFIFNADDINKLFSLLSFFYRSNRSGYQLLKPSILFIEDEYY